MSVELSLSTKIYLITHPAIFTSMTMASLWFVDFNLKSSSVKVIGTLAFWSRSWTVIDDGVHRFEVIVSLLLGFKFHGGPSYDWHNCSEGWQGFRVLRS
jgi:hypothetical protein